MLKKSNCDLLKIYLSLIIHNCGKSQTYNQNNGRNQPCVTCLNGIIIGCVGSSLLECRIRSSGNRFRGFVGSTADYNRNRSLNSGISIGTKLCNPQFKMCNYNIIIISKYAVAYPDYLKYFTPLSKIFWSFSNGTFL